MNRLKDEELANISGGIKLTAGALTIIGGAIAFGIGFVNGLLRPLSCSSSKWLWK